MSHNQSTAPRGKRNINIWNSQKQIIAGERLKPINAHATLPQPNSVVVDKQTSYSVNVADFYSSQR